MQIFQLRPGICSMIKVEDVADVLTEANVKAAEAILLFCQVMYGLSTIYSDIRVFKHRRQKSIGHILYVRCV